MKKSYHILYKETNDAIATKGMTIEAEEQPHIQPSVLALAKFHAENPSLIFVAMYSIEDTGILLRSQLDYKPSEDYKEARKISGM